MSRLPLLPPPPPRPVPRCGNIIHQSDGEGLRYFKQGEGATVMCRGSENSPSVKGNRDEWQDQVGTRGVS